MPPLLYLSTPAVTRSCPADTRVTAFEHRVDYECANGHRWSAGRWRQPRYWVCDRCHWAGNAVAYVNWSYKDFQEAPK